MKSYKEFANIILTFVMFAIYLLFLISFFLLFYFEKKRFIYMNFLPSKFICFVCYFINNAFGTFVYLLIFINFICVDNEYKYYTCYSGKHITWMIFSGITIILVMISFLFNIVFLCIDNPFINQP